MEKYNDGLNLNPKSPTGIFISKIKKNSVVLEFGCAYGKLTKYLKEELNCKVYIVELDEVSIQEAKKYSEDYFLGNIEEYGWIDKYEGMEFDYILFGDVLEHLYYPDKVLNKVEVFLKQEGSILISIPNIAHNAIVMNLLNNKFEYTPTGILDDTHIRFFTLSSLEELIACCNYKIVSKNATYTDINQCEFNNNYDSVKGVSEFFWKTREYGYIYQFVFEIKKSSSYIEEVKNNILKYQNNYNLQIFFDRGEGFSEDNTYIKYLNLNNRNITLSVDINEEIEGIRIDPLNSSCILKINSIVGETIDNEKIKIDIASTNAEFYNDDFYYFLVEDTSLFLDYQYKLKKLYIDFEYLELDINVIKHIINFNLNIFKKLESKNIELESKNIELESKNIELESKNIELESKNIELESKNIELESKNIEIESKNIELESKNIELESKNIEIESKNIEIESKNIDLKSSFDEMQNSNFWKITKPFRYILDKIK